MAIHNTIVISGDGEYFEKLTGEANVLPGMILETTTADAVVSHNTAGGFGSGMVAIEDGLTGNTVDTVYGNGALLKGIIPRPGSILQIRLTDGVSYDEGNLLISAGDGTLKKTTGSPTKVYGEIAEAVDYSVAVSVRLGKVRIY